MSETFTSIKPEVYFSQIYRSLFTIEILIASCTDTVERNQLIVLRDGLQNKVLKLITLYQSVFNKSINIKVPVTEFENLEIHVKFMREYLVKHKNTISEKHPVIEHLLNEVIVEYFIFPYE